MDLINGFGRASPGFGSDPPIGWGWARGCYTLMVSEHPRSDLDRPIGSDQKRGDTVGLSVGYSRVFLLRFLPYL